MEIQKQFNSLGCALDGVRAGALRIVLDFDLSLPFLPCFTIGSQRFIIKA